MSANVSTAQELAILVQHASYYQDIQYLSTATQAMVSINRGGKNRIASFGTTNRLLTTPTWDIGLQKTGYISAAGRCLVMVANIDNAPFIIVLLNTPSAYQRAADAIRIKNWLETGTVASRSQVAKMNPYKQVSKKAKKHKKKKKRS